MLNTILIAALIIAVAVVLMGIRVFFVKNGKFPDTHIGHNTELQKRGISCAAATDAEQRSRKNLADYLSNE